METSGSLISTEASTDLSAEASTDSDSLYRLSREVASLRGLLEEKVNKDEEERHFQRKMMLLLASQPSLPLTSLFTSSSLSSLTSSSVERPRVEETPRVLRRPSPRLSSQTTPLVSASQPSPSLSASSEPFLFNLQSVKEHCDIASSSNQERFIRWRKRLTFDELNAIASSEKQWVVFYNSDEPIRWGRTMDDAMQGVTGMAFVANVVDDEFLDTPQPAASVLTAGRAGHHNGVDYVTCEIQAIPHYQLHHEQVRSELVGLLPPFGIIQFDAERLVPRPHIEPNAFYPMMVDTGCYISFLPGRIAEALDLYRSASIEVALADGAVKKVPTALARIKVDREWYSARFCCPDGESGLLGRNVLKNMHMVWPAGAHCLLTDSGGGAPVPVLVHFPSEAG